MGKKNKPTIYDVAEQSGVSISTISRVLNSPQKVNPATRERVMSAIDDLGFVPKAEARARALTLTKRIGVLTPFLTAPSFVQRLRGVASILSSVNYELVIYPVNSVEHLQGHLSSIPIRRNLDGLIIMSLALEVKDAQRLRENGIETVLIEFFHEDLNSIVIDDMDGGKLAADHLIGKGHRRIAFFGDIEPPERLEIHPVLLRLQGFRKVIREAGLKLPGRYVVQAGYASQNSQRSARALLGAAEPPTAVFAASDIQAIIVIKEANRRGMRIPDDLAVIGFDDIDLAEYMDLTTIRQELDESGKLATEILLSKRLDPDRPPQHLELPLTLIARRTT